VTLGAGEEARLHDPDEIKSNAVKNYFLKVITAFAIFTVFLKRSKLVKLEQAKVTMTSRKKGSNVYFDG
jgi:hypothetical protein